MKIINRVFVALIFSLFLLSSASFAIDPPYCDPTAETCDFRQLGLTSTIKDQGQTNSCSAFAAIAAAEIMYKAKYGTSVDFSEMNLYSCSRKSSRYGGVNFYNLYWALKNGFVIENNQPFSTSKKSVRCVKFTKDQYTKPIDVNVYWIPDSDTSVALLKEIIAYKGPIITALNVNASMSPKTGSNIVGDYDTIAANLALDHAVTIVGWNPTGWIIQNSWGDDWKDGGFATVRYRNNGIGQEIIILEF